MKLLRNYTLKELLLPFFFSLILVTMILLLGRMVQLAHLIINKGVDILLVGELFLYAIPFFLMYTIPLSMICAVLFSFGRLSSDNEIIAIRANGINLGKIIFPVILVGIIVSTSSVLLNDKVVPAAHFAQRKVMSQIVEKNPAALLEPGVFIESFPGYIIFIYHIEGNKMRHIRIYQLQEGKPPRTIVAKRGEFSVHPEEKLIKLKLIDGTTDEPKADDPLSFYKLNFKTYFMPLALPKEGSDFDKKPKEMSLNEIERDITKKKAEGIDPTPLIIAKQEKIAISFAPLVFILLGAPLAITTRRREKTIGFGMAVIIFGAYYLIFMGSKSMGLQGKIEPVLAMWLSNIILGSVGLFLTVRKCVY